MKKTISIAFAAFVLLSFASCQKENLVPENQAPALRTITATFENNGTKTYLGENDKPLWKEGDVIRLLDATNHDDITLTSEMINGGSVTFTTQLGGETLYAVYPASATAMTSCSGSIDFTIPTVQDGTFGSANICVAKGDDKDNLVFSNATAVLEFSQNDLSTDVIRVAVDAANNIAGTLTAEFDGNNKATVTASGLANKTIFTKAVASAENKYYVAIAPVATGAVTFKYYKALEEASASKSSATLAKNTIYTLSIPDDGYENSYVEITADYDNDPNTAETTLKWAKCNIGATKETDYGRYYAWGDITGQAAATSGTGAFATEFSWVNCPFNNGNSDYDGTYFSSVKNTVCPGDVLAKDYDVANKVLGGDWRMPTIEEFVALYALSNQSWQPNYNGSYVNGYLFTDASDNSIFLPAAGCGDGAGLSSAGGSGFYWSSSLKPGSNGYAYYLNFYDGNAELSLIDRYYGQSVRALSE